MDADSPHSSSHNNNDDDDEYSGGSLAPPFHAKLVVRSPSRAPTSAGPPHTSSVGYAQKKHRKVSGERNWGSSPSIVAATETIVSIGKGAHTTTSTGKFTWRDAVSGAIVVVCICVCVHADVN